MLNKQNMYEKMDHHLNSRPRTLENIQEEYSMGADEDLQERGGGSDMLAIKDSNDPDENDVPHDKISNGKLYTVQEVDSARFNQPTIKKRNEEEFDH